MKKEDEVIMPPTMAGFSMDLKHIKLPWPIKRKLLIPMPWTYSAWIEPKYKDEFNFWSKVKMFFSLLLSCCMAIFSEWKENT